MYSNIPSSHSGRNKSLFRALFGIALLRTLHTVMEIELVSETVKDEMAGRVHDLIWSSLSPRH